MFFAKKSVNGNQRQSNMPRLCKCVDHSNRAIRCNRSLRSNSFAESFNMDALQSPLV
jgi:hypothetical protein